MKNKMSEEVFEYCRDKGYFKKFMEFFLEDYQNKDFREQSSSIDVVQSLKNIVNAIVEEEVQNYDEHLLWKNDGRAEFLYDLVFTEGMKQYALKDYKSTINNFFNSFFEYVFDDFASFPKIVNVPTLASYFEEKGVDTSGY